MRGGAAFPATDAGCSDNPSRILYFCYIIPNNNKLFNSNHAQKKQINRQASKLIELNREINIKVLLWD